MYDPYFLKEEVAEQGTREGQKSQAGGRFSGDLPPSQTVQLWP